MHAWRRRTLRICAWRGGRSTLRTRPVEALVVQCLTAALTRNLWLSVWENSTGVTTELHTLRRPSLFLVKSYFGTVMSLRRIVAACCRCHLLSLVICHWGWMQRSLSLFAGSVQGVMDLGPNFWSGPGRFELRQLSTYPTHQPHSLRYLPWASSSAMMKVTSLMRFTLRLFQ